MRRLIVLALATIAALAVAATARADVVWLCKPGLADNPCELPMDTTIRELDGSERVEAPAKDDDREVDCFYVYPTVSNQQRSNATKARDPEVVSIAKYQAARFSQHCTVYAPIYQQSPLIGIAAGAATSGPETARIAYGDVLEAFRAYLAESRGRGFVLLGHSQGTRWLRQLVREEIDGDAGLRRRLVGALLIGGNVTVAAGRTAGGDFDHVPLCTEPLQIGCVVAFSTFAQDPPADARFGRTPIPGREVACTDPRPLARVSTPLRMLTPSEPYARGPIATGIAVTAGGPPPSAPTTWVIPPDRFSGACRRINGAHVLRIEPVGASRRPNPYPDPTWGTHLVDVNIALEQLVALVGRQADRYLRPRLALTRRCVGDGRLRVRLTGRDAGFVRDVSFKLGRRLAVRDTTAGFEGTIARAVLERTRARRLRAVAYLQSGAPRRLVLARPLSRCGL